MCYERQTIGFYYEHDKETDKLYAKPVYAALTGEDGSGGGCCDSSSGGYVSGQLLKSLVWRHYQPCVHSACAAARRSRQQQVRCAAVATDLTCCTTKAEKAKWGVKRGFRPSMSSFMQARSRSFFNPNKQCCFVAAVDGQQCIIGGGFNTPPPFNNPPRVLQGLDVQL